MCTALLAACLLLLTPVFNDQLPHRKYKVALGEQVRENQIKYQVKLLDVRSKTVCGGSIIDVQHVLTAAHCVTLTDSKVSVSARDLLVKCGTTNTANPKTKTHKVEKIILYEGYDPWTLKNDIAILRVQKAFKFDVAVAAIARSPTRPTKGSNCMVSGWGHTEKAEKVQEDLRATYIVILDEGDCAIFGKKFLHEGKLCAGHDKGNDACVGDSGGPLVCGNQLVGVVSSGKKNCGGEGSSGLGLYADVSYYKNWIDLSIKQSAPKPLINIMHIFRKATEEEFPYQVLLLKESGGICSGTIINNNFVLTAAHCVTLGNSSTPMPVRSLRVLAKLINMGEPGSQEYPVQKIIVHPMYNSVNISNDIALLQVEQSFVFSTRVGNISRRNSPLSPAGENGCVVSGWGNINQTNIQQQDLQYMIVDIFSRNNCSQTYGKQLENDKFCAGITEKTDTCIGDPGGPLTCGDELVGVVSARIFCGNISTGNSGIRLYTEVYEHKYWITTVVANVSLENVSVSTSWRRNFHLPVIIYGVIITELIRFSPL